MKWEFSSKEESRRQKRVYLRCFIPCQGNHRYLRVGGEKKERNVRRRQTESESASDGATRTARVRSHDSSLLHHHTIRSLVHWTSRLRDIHSHTYTYKHRILLNADSFKHLLKWPAVSLRVWSSSASPHTLSSDYALPHRFFAQSSSCNNWLCLNFPLISSSVFTSANTFFKGQVSAILHHTMTTCSESSLYSKSKIRGSWGWIMTAVMSCAAILWSCVSVSWLTDPSIREDQFPSAPRFQQLGWEIIVDGQPEC